MSTNTPKTPRLSDAASLPPALGLRTAAAWLGISPTTAYRLVEQDRFPVPVHRIGTSLRVPTTALLTYLGIDPTTAATTPASPADGTDASAAHDAEAAPAAPDTPGPVAAAARAGGEPPRRGLYPVGRPSVDGPRAG